MDTTEYKKRKRKRRRKSKNKQNQQAPVNNGIPFKWEYAFESLTERGSKFRKNPPEYE